jgi:glycine/D-amino acid oxidase-like deaminating enzyme/nitrite reductase/ring-hydroxylating ferredoxin subunit
LDDRYYELQRIFGKDHAKLIAESHAAAIDFIGQTVQNENIDCDFERLTGYLFLHPTDKETSLDKEYKAALECGLKVTMLDAIPGMMLNQQPCLKFENQAQFHPLKYLKSLCHAIQKMGGQIFTETHASEMNATGIRTDEGFRVEAGNIVVATNSPVNDEYTMHLKQFAYRTYAIGALIRKRSVDHALWWDTGDHEVNAGIPPYHYVRMQPYDADYDVLISGGEDHPTGLAIDKEVSEENRYELLEKWTGRRFSIEEVIWKWSGQVLEPMDSIAYIGRNPGDKKNVYIVTGDSGNGMTHGTIAGFLITDLITGKENPWSKIYDPSRLKIFKSGKIWLKEFVGGYFAYLKNAPRHADSVQLSGIKKGEGKIVEFQKEKFGVYRDEQNTMHIVSAECTHLQCIIKWNNDEKSWDCPCHGSRFTYKGEVMNGPANEKLFYYKEDNPEFLELLKQA